MKRFAWKADLTLEFKIRVSELIIVKNVRSMAFSAFSTTDFNLTVSGWIVTQRHNM